MNWTQTIGLIAVCSTGLVDCKNDGKFDAIRKRSWLSGVEPPSDTAYLGDPCETTVNCIVPHSVCSKLSDTFWTRSQKFCACRPGYHPATGYCDINVKKTIHMEIENDTLSVHPKSSSLNSQQKQADEGNDEQQGELLKIPESHDIAVENSVRPKLSKAEKLLKFNEFVEGLEGKANYPPFAETESGRRKEPHLLNGFKFQATTEKLNPDFDGEEKIYHSTFSHKDLEQSSDFLESSEFLMDDSKSTTQFPSNPWGYSPGPRKTILDTPLEFSMKNRFSPHLIPSRYVETTADKPPTTTPKPISAQQIIKDNFMEPKILKKIVSDISQQVVEQYIRTLFKSMVSQSKNAVLNTVKDSSK